MNNEYIVNEFIELEEEFEDAIANMQGPDTKDATVIRKAMILIMNSDADDTVEQRELMDGFSKFMFPQSQQEQHEQVGYANMITRLFAERNES